MKKTSEVAARYLYIDLIRIISCVFVVIVHVSAIEWNTLSVTSIEWNIANTFNCIGMNGVPLFFMISGALILNSDYRITTKKLFVNKIGKLLLAYLLTMFFYNVIPFLRGWIPWEWNFIRDSLLEGTIYGTGIYHMWFIPVLLVLYMLVPVLKEAFSKKKICEYYLILFGVIGIVLPTLQLIDLPMPLKRFFSFYQGKLSLFMVTGYIGYFVLGHYLHTFVGKMNKKSKITVGIVTLLAILFTVAGCAFDAIGTNTASALFNTPFTINIFLSCCGIYLLCKELNEEKASDKCKRVMHNFAGYTLGIYLIHPFILDLFSPLLVELKNWIPIYFLCIVFRLLIVVTVSTAIIFVLKKIPGIKKII